MTDADRSALPSEAELERRLLGVALPDLELDCAYEALIHLPELARRSNLAIFFYRGLNGAPPDLQFSDDARAQEWADHDYELDKLGYLTIGISVQTVTGQATLAGGEPLPYMLLSDPEFRLAEALDLPTSDGDGGPAYEPLTMLVREEGISRIFFPIDPARDAASAVEWIKRETRP
jgi:peroxiredoxin